MTGGPMDPHDGLGGSQGGTAGNVIMPATAGVWVVRHLPIPPLPLSKTYHLAPPPSNSRNARSLITYPSPRLLPSPTHPIPSTEPRRRTISVSVCPLRRSDQRESKTARRNKRYVAYLWLLLLQITRRVSFRLFVGFWYGFLVPLLLPACFDRSERSRGPFVLLLL
jgi:hypothetical protein